MRTRVPRKCLLAAAVAAVVFPETYTAAYRFLPERYTMAAMGKPDHYRVFSEDWQGRLFRPAARIEAFVRGRDFSLVLQTPNGNVRFSDVFTGKDSPRDLMASRFIVQPRGVSVRAISPIGTPD